MLFDLSDGGSRISLHLAEERDQAVVLVLSHQQGLASGGDDEVMMQMAGCGVSSCGVDAADDGRRMWAVLDRLSPEQVGGGGRFRGAVPAP